MKARYECAPTGTSSRGADAKATAGADRQPHPNAEATPEQRRAQLRVIQGGGAGRPSRFGVALAALTIESSIVAAAAEMVLEGQVLDGSDRTRLAIARLRLRDAMAVFGG